MAIVVGFVPNPEGRAALTRAIQEAVEATDPADQLLRVADETNAELIVIGLRRRTPVGKLIMGSAAQTILLEAEAPVLAVKAPRSSGR